MSLDLLGTRGRRDRVVGACMLLTFVLLPILQARVVKTIALSDVSLAVAALVAFLGGPIGRPPAQLLTRTLVVGVGLLATGGLIGLVAADAPLDSAVLLGRLLLAAVGSIVLILWWDPPAVMVRRLLAVFVLEAAISAGFGVLGATIDAGWTNSWRDPIERATGVTGNANHLGAISAIGFALAVGLALVVPSVRRLRPAVWTTLWLVAAATLLAGVLWSGSRSGLVGAAGGVVLVVIQLVRTRRWRPLVLAGAGVVVVCVLSVTSVVRVPALDRVLQRTDTEASTYSVESTERRIDLASERLDRAGAGSLLWGSGMENQSTTGGHSGYLEIWVGTGMLGFAGWLTVCATTLAPVGRAAWRRRLSLRTAVLLSVGAGFLAHLASTLFLEHIWDRYIWLLVALVVALRHPAESDDVDPEEGGDAPEAEGAVGPSVS